MPSARATSTTVDLAGPTRRSPGLRGAGLHIGLAPKSATITVDGHLPTQSPKTLISFVVPAYNEERLLGRTLEALHAAARAVAEPYELIVVDDGSTDGT